MTEQPNLNKQVYSKTQYQKVIDTSFTQLVQPVIIPSVVAPSISIAEFFLNYQKLFFEIPKFGDINSHEYLIKTSQQYAGDFNNDDTIQALIEEVTQLRNENLDLLQQQIPQLQQQQPQLRQQQLNQQQQQQQQPQQPQQPQLPPTRTTSNRTISNIKQQNVETN